MTDEKVKEPQTPRAPAIKWHLIKTKQTLKDAQHYAGNYNPDDVKIIEDNGVYKVLIKDGIDTK